MLTITNYIALYDHGSDCVGTFMRFGKKLVCKITSVDNIQTL